MKIRTFTRVFPLLLAIGATLTACGGDDDDGDGAGGAGGAEPEATTVEITSWWSGPGEAEALTALIDVHEEAYPNVTIFNSSADDGTDSELSIEERLEAGDPPDAFQENVHDIAELLELFPGSLEPLDQLFEDEGWNDVMLPEVLETITIDGHIYAMPVGTHRENAVFVNEAVFKEQSVDAPTNITELLSACQTLSDNGVTCLATGGQGWIQRIMFLDVVMGTMGGAEFQEFFAGDGDPADANFAAAVDNYRTIVDNYISPDLWITEDCQDMNGDAIDRCLDGSQGWQEASQALFDGEAALFMHGDWVGGYVQQLGWDAGVDYSVIGAPGASDTFLFGVDTFVVPADSENKAGALDFCRTIGSLDGQAAFNNVKGSTPVRLDADTSLLTPVGKQALEDLNNADVVMAAPTFEDMDDFILDFANGAMTEAELIAAFEAGLYN